MRPGYSVSVFKDGEAIVTIGPDLSGLAEFSYDDANAIRDAGEHLLAFIGSSDPTPCFACGGVDVCTNGCPLSERPA